ncbi:hypothetical protein D9M68_497410 [compost metagenome]
MKNLLLRHQAFLANFICSLLILLWVYTAASKLADLHEFKRQMGNQVFSKAIARFLIVFIPVSEITAALLLLFTKTRYAGFMLSVFLLFLFTSYIGLVLAGYYARVPCSCGGVLKALGWQAHFVFNLCFLALASLALCLETFNPPVKPLP